MKDIISRVGIIYFFMVLSALLVTGRIVHLQFFAELPVSSEEISFRTEEIESVRGSILSNDGRSLASSVPYYQIRMDCVFPEDTLFNNNIDSLAHSLSGFFKDKSAIHYKSELIAARKKGNRYKAIGNRLVDYSELMELKRFPLFRERGNRGGFISEQKNRRNNPYGRLAYRTIGFINSNGVGVGIEGSYDYYLKGIPGKQTVQRLLGGEWMPVNEEETIMPMDGMDVETTIDIDIQEAAENALRNQLSLSDVFEGATAIVMEVETGAIRAITNMKKMSNGEFDESFNYAISQATEPGSTFKLATLVALIEDGYVTLETPIDAGNGKWKYSTKEFTDVTRGGYGLIDVRKAFEKSSNVAFAKLAVEYYANNEKKYIDRLHNMKIGEKFNLDIMGEGRSVIHTPGDAMWNKLTLPMMAMGYASLLTPLHTLAFYNAIANGGKMMKPYFVESLQRHGVIEKKFEPQEMSGAICSKSTIKMVHEALRGVVEHGTAKALDDPRYKISGKTGTAQIAFDGRYRDAQGYRKHQASFAGFFPSDNPKYTAIVVLYTNKTRANFYGGSWAAPVFKLISDRIYANNPQWSNPVDGKGKVTTSKPLILSGKREETEKLISFLPAVKTEGKARGEWLSVSKDSLNRLVIKDYIAIADSVPNVVNMGLRDALYILENRGYRVRFSGKGRIISQNPVAGSALQKNGIIEIQLSEEYETE
ncbi:MAG: penicillin-binding protein [Bacteroidales bacterium]|jgi:cell division protein FtsI (penicillin-binding protein 3)|nr:penicillin-binding protein [Bacteroidales bacterium]MDD4058148.1 penicillin-binding protein [Bacteroidales bacterium]